MTSISVKTLAQSRVIVAETSVGAVNVAKVAELAKVRSDVSSQCFGCAVGLIHSSGRRIVASRTVTELTRWSEELCLLGLIST
jgi:hypothetical protein